MIPFNNSCMAQCPPNHQETVIEQDGKPVYLGKDGDKRPKYTCKLCSGKPKFFPFSLFDLFASP
jgi:hypothetical protein